eukprot:4844-Heterococcus_DN1.PRE.2
MLIEMTVLLTNMRHITRNHYISTHIYMHTRHTGHISSDSESSDARDSHKAAGRAAVSAG